MAKESLFNILQNRLDFEDIDVLDLFSGTGSISFEFASRETKHVVAVEKDFRYARFIQDTAKQFGFDRLNVVKSDCFKFMAGTRLKFDLVFADPPYELESLKTIPDLIFEYGLLKENGSFILEHPAAYSFTGHPYFTEMRNYSRVHFSFFG
jgi:16S rRNA (guanine(966)-N(2))-methyltransferase RsmD